MSSMQGAAAFIVAISVMATVQALAVVAVVLALIAAAIVLVTALQRASEPAPIALCPLCGIDLVSNPQVVHRVNSEQPGIYALRCPCGESSKWNFDPPRAEGTPAVPVLLERWRTRPHVVGSHGQSPRVNGRAQDTRERSSEIRMCDSGCGKVVPVGSVRWYTGEWLCPHCKAVSVRLRQNAESVM